MKAFLTHDGNWIARCLATGVTASGGSRLAAIFKLSQVIKGATA